MLSLKIKCLMILCVIVTCECLETKVEISPVTKIEFKPIKELPSDIPTCKQSDININECIKSAFQEMIPRLKNGIPELNIPPLDPFVLEKSRYQYSQGAIQGRLSLKNVYVYGLSDSIVQSANLKINEKKMNLKIVTFIPKLYLEGTYKGDVKINDLKLNPKGYFNITITNIVMNAKPEGELYEKDGHTYLRLLKFNASPEIEDLKIFATGLLDDAELNAVVLDFANQYWRQIHQAMLPEAQKRWDPIMLDTANEFFASLPFDFIIKNE